MKENSTLNTHRTWYFDTEKEHLQFLKKLNKDFTFSGSYNRLLRRHTSQVITAKKSATNNVFVLETLLICFKLAHMTYFYSGQFSTTRRQLNPKAKTGCTAPCMPSLSRCEMDMDTGLRKANHDETFCNPKEYADAHLLEFKQDSACEFVKVDQQFNLRYYIVSKENKWDTHCFVASSADKIIISFRGTSSATNAWADLKLRQVKLFKDSSIRVHNGFLRSIGHISSKPIEEEFDTNKDSIDNVSQGFQDGVSYAVTSLLKEQQNRKVLLTGHSLGGALAQIFSLLLKRDTRVATNDIHCYTFAAPRSGNKSYRTAFEDEVNSCYRLELILDPVPQIPFRLSLLSLLDREYMHAGKNALLDLKGNLIVDSHPIDRLVLNTLKYFSLEGCLKYGQCSSIRRHSCKTYALGLMLFVAKMNAETSKLKHIWWPEIKAEVLESLDYKKLPEKVKLTLAPQLEESAKKPSHVMRKSILSIA